MDTKSLSKTESILQDIRKSGKVETLNTSEHINIISEMNANLEEARRNYRIKEMKSAEAASKVLITD
ncbi:MAG: hypothetical protein WCR58_10475 [Bacteroidales bacterium]|jgi:hypothetical protein|nr:hypothetical protein [Bacteroidales bacterium]MDY0370338.1 hypothetical protein [Bacteroidales bacterium]